MCYGTLPIVKLGRLQPHWRTARTLRFDLHECMPRHALTQLAVRPPIPRYRPAHVPAAQKTTAHIRAVALRSRRQVAWPAMKSST